MLILFNICQSPLFFCPLQRQEITNATFNAHVLTSYAASHRGNAAVLSLAIFSLSWEGDNDFYVYTLLTQEGLILSWLWNYLSSGNKPKPSFKISAIF